MGTLRRPLLRMFLTAVLVSTGALFAESPAIPKMSAFAPAKDLIAQVDFFIKRMEESLSDPADFDLAKQSRTVKDANTLAALALVLGVHDEDHEIKATMPAMLASAQALAVAGEDAKKATVSLDGIKRARAGGPGDATGIKWEKAAALAPLMKQVPLVHTGLKRGVEPNRLARQATQSAGQAATLVAIAQASMLDPEPAKNLAERELWIRYCAEMRDAAGEINSAVHAQDQGRVAGGMKRLTQSCDACHEKFRHP